MRAMNKYQKAICKTYGGGEYAYLVDAEESCTQIQDAGDPLFTFLINELRDDDGEPMTQETARQRIEGAAHDVERARYAVEQAT